LSEFRAICRLWEATTAKRMKIGQYCQQQRCKHVELEQFWQAFASRGFVSDSWAFLSYLWESACQNSGSGVIFVVIVRLFSS